MVRRLSIFFICSFTLDKFYKFFAAAFKTLLNFPKAVIVHHNLLKYNHLASYRLKHVLDLK